MGNKILEVIHLLELTDLEEKYLHYLERNMNEQNCLQIHHYADLYQCEWLKALAWNKLTQIVSEYALPPQDTIKPFSHIEDELAEEDEGEGLDDFTPLYDKNSEEGNATSGERPGNAFMVVQSWMERLQEAYEACTPTIEDSTSEVSEVETGGGIKHGEASTYDGDIKEVRKSSPPPKPAKKNKKIIDYRAAVLAFYEQHNPSRVAEVDEIMITWQGREDVLLVELHDKYKVP